MSYDIWLVIDTGDIEPVSIGDSWNYTSNCAPMWREAGCDLALCSGRPASHVGIGIRHALERMSAEPAKYEAMNPKNGHGDYVSLMEALDRLAHMCETNPRCSVLVSN